MAQPTPDRPSRKDGIVVTRGEREYRIKPCASSPWWNWTIHYRGVLTYDECRRSRAEAIDAICRISDVSPADFEPLPGPRAPEEIAELKGEWFEDPTWDLEETPGFEDHHVELLIYRNECEMRWESERLAHEAAEARRIDARARELDCSTALVRYVESLEGQIAQIKAASA